MPIYEYQCHHCCHTFELIQKINDIPPEDCPHCHQKTVTRLVSAAGFQLKGTGWYVTDFKNKSAATPAKTTTEKPAETAACCKGATSCKTPSTATGE